MGDSAAVPFIDQARALDVSLRRALAGLGTREYPERVLRSLFSQASGEYQALLTLLETGFECADAADILLRALLEYAAHTRWICGTSGSGSDVRTRSLCYELGAVRLMAKQFQRTWHSTIAPHIVPVIKGALAEKGELATALGGFPGISSEAVLSEALSWGKEIPALQPELKAVEAAHAETGCTCEGRKYGVQLELEADAVRDPVAHFYWIYNSSLAHHFFPTILFDDEGHSPWATVPAYRSLLQLGYSTDVFVGSSLLIAPALGMPEIEDLTAQLAELGQAIADRMVALSLSS